MSTREEDIQQHIKQSGSTIHDSERVIREQGFPENDLYLSPEFEEYARELKHQGKIITIIKDGILRVGRIIFENKKK